MKLLLLLLLLVLACGDPQSYPYAIKASAEAPVLEFLRGGATPYESITFTTKLNPIQTGKLVLNSKAKTLKQSLTVPSLRYRVEAKYILDQQQQLESHFQQTGSTDNDKPLLDMLVVVSASDSLRAWRSKIVPLLTEIVSSLPNSENTENIEQTEQKKVDWQLALVSADASDDKCLVVNTLTELQALNIDDFAFSDDERVIHKASAALGLEDETICSSFPRNNSQLVILATSDKDHQCDMDNPPDSSGKTNTRNKYTSFYCGSSLTRFHSKLKQDRHNEKLKLYALLDSKSSCEQQASNTCYDYSRNQNTSNCKFTNPCYNRANSYLYASANYRRANIFDLIRHINTDDYSKITTDLKADISSLFSFAEESKASPFIARLTLGEGVVAASVVVKIDGVVLPRKHYRLGKHGVVLLVGDVRKHFPAGSTAVVTYKAKRSHKHLRLPQIQGVSSLLVRGVDDYEFIAKKGLLVFQEPLALKSKISVSYEYEVNTTATVAHRANIGDATVDEVECCLSSNCASNFSCQLNDDILTHTHSKQIKGGTSFTANYTFANTVREFFVPHNCEKTSLFLKLDDIRCSKLDIVDDSIIKLTSIQAKDNCQVFNNYRDTDDVELHYQFSRQDSSLQLSPMPDAELLLKVNGVPQKPVNDYLIDDDKIQFLQPLPTNAAVKASFSR